MIYLAKTLFGPLKPIYAQSRLNDTPTLYVSHANSMSNNTNEIVQRLRYDTNSRKREMKEKE